MMTLLEDLRLALRQICSEFGREGTAVTAVPLVVLGLALNFAALSATEFVRHGGRPIHQHSALRNAARTELNAVRIVVHSAIRKINATQQRWGRTQQWVKDGQKKIDGYHVEVGVVWAPSTPNEDCGIKLLGNTAWTRMVAVVQC
ncbi:MAG: hypothetical protein WDN23_06855 [Edaphobacter sp.]